MFNTLKLTQILVWGSIWLKVNHEKTKWHYIRFNIIIFYTNTLLIRTKFALNVNWEIMKQIKICIVSTMKNKNLVTFKVTVGRIHILWLSIPCSRQFSTNLLISQNEQGWCSVFAAFLLSGNINFDKICLLITLHSK